MTKFSWTAENVSATKPAARAIRQYMEQAQLRDILKSLPLEEPEFTAVAEFGCGFGRLLPVLSEFADTVYGFERSMAMAMQAQKLLPPMNVFNVENLWSWPGVDSFNLSMTFTVLQHMADKDVIRVIENMKKATRLDGYIIIGEDTDPTYHFQDKQDLSHFTHGRSVKWYREKMAPWKILKVFPRKVEAGYKSRGKARPIVGHWMVFEGAE